MTSELPRFGNQKNAIVFADEDDETVEFVALSNSYHAREEEYGI